MSIGLSRSPCKSCPYRQDVPSGIWHESEYLKLPAFDADTAYQPTGVFLCHQQNGCLCRGWLDCHGTELLSVRIAIANGYLQAEEIIKAIDEGPAVAVFESGCDAATHGIMDITDPGPEAIRLMAKIKGQRKHAKRVY